jgi:hypothetical protein
MRKVSLYAGVAAIAIAAGLTAPPTAPSAQQPTSAVTVGASDLGGVVSGAGGPEAGVWVIAETTDLAT